MKLAILAGALGSAAEIYRHMKDLGETWVVLCKEDNRGFFVRMLKELFHIWKGVRLLATRKVIFLRNALDHPRSLAILKKHRFDIGLHKAGIIYRNPTVECFEMGILNAHIGLLPEYKGRSVMEWSLLQGDPLGITVFFIDGGIDTGRRIVLSEVVHVSHCKSVREAKQYLFSLDAAFYRRAIEKLKSQDFRFETNEGGKRYYVMSKLFTKVVDSLMQSPS